MSISNAILGWLDRHAGRLCLYGYMAMLFGYLMYAVFAIGNAIGG